MSKSVADLARQLAHDAEAVCRHYLSNGRRQGRYWIVGDLANNPGRSLYVRLHGPDHGKGAAGNWTDAATGERGDLLDLIRGAHRLGTMREAVDEARRFLSLPRPEPQQCLAPAPAGSPEAARRLFAMARPIRGTLAETYLRHRGITYLQSPHDLGNRLQQQSVPSQRVGIRPPQAVSAQQVGTRDQAHQHALCVDHGRLPQLVAGQQGPGVAQGGAIGHGE